MTFLTGVRKLRFETSLVHVWKIGAKTSLTGYDDLVVKAFIACAWKVARGFAGDKTGI